MAWIPLNQRPAELRKALETLQQQRGGNPTVEELYNQQEFGLLSDQQLAERLAALQTTSPVAAPPPRFREGQAFEVKSLRYLRNSAATAEDRRWAETLHDTMLLELWLQHVTESGDTYYPALAEDLLQSFQLMEDGHHD